MVTANTVYQVKSGLILDQLAKEFAIETSEKDLDQKLEEMAERSGLTVAQLKEFYFKDDKVKNNMLYAIREEKTFAKLAEKVKLS